jgi:DNA modification methylase
MIPLKKQSIAQQMLPFDSPSQSLEIVLRPYERGQAEDVFPVFSLAPNPYLADFVDLTSEPKQVNEPYHLDISSGKNTYVYDAHTYHTKVPPQGIELLVEYYTRPGDVVLDPFCGSGMTGVAALEKGRKAILSDLSPAAAFIAFNLTNPIEETAYMDAIKRILKASEELEQKLYNTHCRTCGKFVPILYTVWSYGMLCTFCKEEFNLWDVARDERPTVKESKIKKDFECPHCGEMLKKRLLKKTRRSPVLIGYHCCERGRQEEKAVPDEHDLALLSELEQQGVPENLWYPTTPLPKGVNTNQPIAAGILSVDKMYTTRALWAMSHLWALASQWPDLEMRPKLLFTLTSLYQRVTVFSEFRFWGGSSNTANFNVPSIMNEQNVFKTFERKAATIALYFKTAYRGQRQVRISTQSACHLTQIPDQSIDYVFTDPPFGANINYSEMNFLWESWLGTRTDPSEEAIVNKVQGKDVLQYRQLLAQSFSEVRRVLKDNAWMTVIFHNSAAKVWEALQFAISYAGFTIEASQIFDKEHGTFKQFVSDNAVGYDLVLHCRKSSGQVTRSNEEQEVQPNNAAEVIRQDALHFIHRAMKASPDEYIVRYLHVAREDELDYRRLYSEWLAHALPRMMVGLGFEKFRELVDQVKDTSDSIG